MSKNHPDSSMTGILSQLSLADSSEQMVEQIFETSLASDTLQSLGFLNQHGFNLITKDKVIAEDFQQLDYLLRDGIGIKLALKLFNFNPKANLNGTDFIPQLLQRFEGVDAQYFIFGTQFPWLELGAKSLLPNSPVVLLDGFKESSEYLQCLSEIRDSSKFSVILLAMGMPKQENLAAQIKTALPGKGVVICGGAIVDFQAGRFQRAPGWVRSLSLEWLYRLIKEPKRLFKRYVVGIPLFFLRLMRLKFNC